MSRHSQIRRGLWSGLAVVALSMALVGAPAVLSWPGAVPSGVAFAKGGDGGGGDDGGGSGKGGDDGGGGDDRGGDDRGGDDRDGGKGRGRGGDDDADKDKDKADDSRDRGSRDRGSSSRSSGARAISISPDGISVTFNDGASADIRNGRYSYRDRNGRVTERRQATGADIALMKSIANGLSAVRPDVRGQGGVRVVRTDTTPSRTRISYSNGWVEEVRGGTYRLVDGFGNPVVSRPATQADRSRLTGLANR